MSSALIRRIRDGLRSRYLRNSGVVAVGAGFSHGLALLAYPVLARLYTPAEFGLLAQFQAVVLLLQGAAALRYEVAIPLAADDGEARNVARLGLWVIAGTSLFVALVLAAVGRQIFSLVSLTEVFPFHWLLPIGMAGGGFFQLASYWTIRAGAFPVLALGKLWQTFGGLVAQLAGGLAGAGAIGLCIGSVLGQALGIRLLAKRVGFPCRSGGETAGVKELIGTARHFGSTSLFSTVSGVLNTLGLQLPFLLMSHYYGLQAAGYLLIGTRIFSASSDLVGNAVAQTYYGEAAASFRADTARFRRIFFRTAAMLAGAGCIFALLVWLLAPWVIDAFFGMQWLAVGQYARALTFWYVGNLICSPLSTTVYILRRPAIQFIWDLFRIGVIVGAFMISAHFGWTDVQAVTAFSLGGGIAFLILVGINILLVVRATERADERINLL